MTGLATKDVASAGPSFLSVPHLELGPDVLVLVDSAHKTDVVGHNVVAGDHFLEHHLKGGLAVAFTFTAVQSVAEVVLDGHDGRVVGCFFSILRLPGERREGREMSRKSEEASSAQQACGATVRATAYHGSEAKRGMLLEIRVKVDDGIVVLGKEERMRHCGV